MKTALIEEPTFEILPPDVAAASTELSCPADKVAALYAPFEKPFIAAAELLAVEESATTAFDARTLRLKMVKARTTIAATKDESKSDIKLAGNIIDWFHNKGRDRLAAAEARLLEIEKAEERAEAARIEALREERAETLESMGHDWHGISLGAMSDDAWQVYLQQAKDVYEMRAIRAKREADEAAAEKKRVAEEKEAARLEKERIQEEAKAAAEAAEIERQKALAELLKEREAKAKIEAEAKAAAEAAEIERQKALAEILKEREAKAKVEAEAQALRDAEAKRIADQKAAEAAKVKADAAAAKKAAAAPDRERLLAVAKAIGEIQVPGMKSNEAQSVKLELDQRLNDIQEWIETQAASL